MTPLNHTLSISAMTRSSLTPSCLCAMTGINAKRADWLLYLRLMRHVTDEVPDPEQPGEMIGMVQHGQTIDVLDLWSHFPTWRIGRLRYRLRKLVNGGVLIRSRTPSGYRLAVRFSSASRRRNVTRMSFENFGWLRRPIQLPLFPALNQVAKRVKPGGLPIAA